MQAQHCREGSKLVGAPVVVGEVGPKRSLLSTQKLFASKNISRSYVSHPYPKTSHDNVN